MYYGSTNKQNWLTVYRRNIDILLSFINVYPWGPYKSIISPIIRNGNTEEGFSFVIQGTYSIPGHMEKSTKFLSDFESLFRTAFLDSGKHLDVKAGFTMNSIIVTVPPAITKYEKWVMLFETEKTNS